MRIARRGARPCNIGRPPRLARQSTAVRPWRMRGKAAPLEARHRRRLATDWRLLRGNEGVKRARQRRPLPSRAMRVQRRRQPSRYSASVSPTRARRSDGTRCFWKPALRRGTSMDAQTRRARSDLPMAPRRARTLGCGCQSRRDMLHCSARWASTKRCARPPRRTSTSTPISSRTMRRRLGRTKRSSIERQRRRCAMCRQRRGRRARAPPAREL